jgi:DeoR/GlpR family transcriptional regulator of sugar metabolism
MAKLLKEQRQRQILRSLQKNGQVTIPALSEEFSVSEVTIRRDLRDLADKRLLERTHGGAVVAYPTQAEAPVIQRMLTESETKDAIGRAAASLIDDGEAVLIGSGSTTAYVARYLIHREELTVVTNALNVGVELAAAKNVMVVVVGGMLRSSELSLIGHIAEQSLQEVRVDKVIIGIPAISLESGLSNDYMPEVKTDRAIINMASELIVVADHTKLGKTASAYLAPLEIVTTLVTDSGADPNYLAAIQKIGVNVIIAR